MPTGTRAFAARGSGGLGRCALDCAGLVGAGADEVPAAFQEFYASEEGIAWLHRQVLVAHLVITLFANGGIRPVCTFLELSGLSAFVASSYGRRVN